MRMAELWYERKSITDAEGYHLPVAIEEAMTLRDKFAMAALPALIQLHSIETVKEAAGAAYYIADAMLKARKEK